MRPVLTSSAERITMVRMQMTQPLTVPLAERVAREIRGTLGHLGINQAELARRLGVSDQWVSVRVRPHASRPIDLAELEQIAAALGVPVSRLLPTPERAGGGE